MAVVAAIGGLVRLRQAHRVLAASSPITPYSRTTTRAPAPPSVRGSPGPAQVTVVPSPMSQRIEVTLPRGCGEQSPGSSP